MKVRDWLIGYMKFKAGMVQEKLGIPASIYFNDYDADIFQVYDEERLKEVAREIVDVIRGGSASNLSSALCPFCYLFSHDCDRCFYGNRHGKCLLAGSTLHVIKEEAMGKELISLAEYRRWLDGDG